MPQPCKPTDTLPDAVAPAAPGERVLARQDGPPVLRWASFSGMIGQRPVGIPNVSLCLRGGASRRKCGRGLRGVARHFRPDTGVRREVFRR